MQGLPSDGVPGVSEAEGLGLSDEAAPDPELRAARHEIRAVAAGLRAALAADDLLAAAARPAEEGRR